MKRRDFLKAVGIAVLAPTAILKAAGGQAGLTNFISTLYAKKIWHYTMFIHPKQKYQLKVSLARDKYKHKRWLERHNRWLAKQGKPPIQDAKGECEKCTFQGMKFIDYENLDAA